LGKDVPAWLPTEENTPGDGDVRMVDDGGLGRYRFG
jgi:hypothetical protein